MTRPLRIEYEGAWYHVMSRGASRREIFKTDQHRELFFEWLNPISIKFKVETHATIAKKFGNISSGRV